MDPRMVARNNVLFRRPRRRICCFRHLVRVNFYFYHMCLYSKCSDFSGEFKNAQSQVVSTSSVTCSYFICPTGERELTQASLRDIR